MLFSVMSILHKIHNYLFTEEEIETQIFLIPEENVHHLPVKLLFLLFSSVSKGELKERRRETFYQGLL